MADLHTPNNVCRGGQPVDKKLALYGFNNLTKTLSFNIYDVCYAKSEREQKDYIAYITPTD